MRNYRVIKSREFNVIRDYFCYNGLIINWIGNFNKRILSIGDNLNTDIKGANVLNYHSLLISNGIHKKEIKDKGIEEVSKQYEAIVNYIQSDLKW